MPRLTLLCSLFRRGKKDTEFVKQRISTNFADGTKASHRNANDSNVVNKHGRSLSNKEQTNWESPCLIPNLSNGKEPQVVIPHDHLYYRLLVVHFEHFVVNTSQSEDEINKQIRELIRCLQ